MTIEIRAAPIKAQALEVPRRLRAWVRAREVGTVLLAAVVGAVAGLVVAVMGGIVTSLHELFFQLDPGQRLSAAKAIDPIAVLLVPCIGGLLLGLANLSLQRFDTERLVDPIEANAVRGGRMSFRGSMIVALQTIWSSGVGASVGLEAGYTQLASGIASWIGRAFRLRRRIGGIDGGRILRSLAKLVVSSGVTAAGLAAGLVALGDVSGRGLVVRAGVVAGGALGALVVGGVLMRLLRVDELSLLGELGRSMRARFGRG